MKEQGQERIASSISRAWKVMVVFLREQHSESDDWQEANVCRQLDCLCEGNNNVTEARPGAELGDHG